jgi:hypothetical protein
MPKLVTTYLYPEQRAEVLYGEPMAALGRRARSLHDRTRPAGAVTVSVSYNNDALTCDRQPCNFDLETCNTALLPNLDGCDLVTM